MEIKLDMIEESHDTWNQGIYAAKDILIQLDPVQSFEA